MIQQTSLLAYESIQHELGERQKIVLDGLKDLGEATNLMIAKHLGLPINSVTPRIFELREKRLVEQSHTAFCKVSKRLAKYWRVLK